MHTGFHSIVVRCFGVALRAMAEGERTVAALLPNLKGLGVALRAM